MRSKIWKETNILHSSLVLLKLCTSILLKKTIPDTDMKTNGEWVEWVSTSQTYGSRWSADSNQFHQRFALNHFKARRCIGHNLCLHLMVQQQMTRCCSITKTTRTQYSRQINIFNGLGKNKFNFFPFDNFQFIILLQMLVFMQHMDTCEWLYMCVCMCVCIYVCTKK